MTAPATRGWQFWIDRGGTFTDLVGLSPDGQMITHKLLSSHPEAYRDAALQGMRDILRLDAGSPIESVQFVRMGTTVATNALLERMGEPVLLAITEGFADALRIAYQNRPKLFDREIRLPAPLYGNVIEIPERISADGRVIRPLDQPLFLKRLRSAPNDGYQAIAISCLHGYRNPEHESQALKLALEAGFRQLSVGHEMSRLWKLIPRSDTAVVEAYLAPGLKRYVQSVSAELPNIPLQFMQSSGGLADAHRFHARNAILSGPAGGIVGAVKVAKEAGLEKIITFDMGGTSTDVAHYAGQFERSLESEVVGVRLRAAMLHIHTVAAGGGSICRFSQGRLQVGPASAGADPGPAAYGRGGPLTITDCNVLLGRIRADHFPAVFGPGRNQPLDGEATRLAFQSVAQDIHGETGQHWSAEDIATGCLKIAVQNMASAIKKISVQRGYDPRDYALVTFGGAGGQHACQVAESLGMRRVLLHPLAGVLSAYGIGMAEVSILRQLTVGCPIGADHQSDLDKAVSRVRAHAEQELAAQSTAGPVRSTQIRVRLRYAGSDTGLLVRLDSMSAMKAVFERRHLRRFGFIQSGGELVIDSVEAEATARNPAQTIASISSLRTAVPTDMAANDNGMPVLGRAALSDQRMPGPAVVVEPNSTIYVDTAWSVRLLDSGALMLERDAFLPESGAGPTAAAIASPGSGQSAISRDPVLLEIFNNLFMSIAEQMGFALQTTAHSVNIKERLDFSCGIFDTQGHLVANAPHMPVHLGSMGESVAAIVARWGKRMRPGDAFVLNAPYGGGTHLPDITVVTPAFVHPDGPVEFFLASRGHHADVGGLTPGSMPAESRHIEDEGVLFEGERIVAQGEFLESQMLARLGSGPYPARNPGQNIADLKAQVAANQKGAVELERLVEHYGLDTVRAYMGHVQDNAEEAVVHAISQLKGGTFRLVMDGGAEIAVEISLNTQRTRARVDFTGTSPQQLSNYNAPGRFAVLLYCMCFERLSMKIFP